MKFVLIIFHQIFIYDKTWLLEIITFIALFLERWLYGNASFSSNDHYFSSRRQFYIKNFFHVCSGIEDSVLVHGIHKWENLKLHLQQKKKNSFCCGKKLDTFFCKKWSFLWIFATWWQDCFCETLRLLKVFKF